MLPNALYGAAVRVVGKYLGMPKVQKYGHNIMISVSQFGATKGFGQDPDTSISMFLGIAKKLHMEGKAKVDKIWLVFSDFVDVLFFFEKDHTKLAIEKDESSKDAIISIHDKSPQAREVKA